MYPTSTYFGCHLRYNELTHNNDYHWTEHTVICAFATKNTGKGPSIQEGLISEESCSEAEPKGVLEATSHDSLLCVGACRCYYRYYVPLQYVL
jgi:hypothetical protein